MDSQQAEKESEHVVTWGDEVVASGSSPKKELKQYESFVLKGATYRVGDAVYLQAPDGPPYIGKILRLTQGKQKKLMQVRWFCRPSELPEGLPEVDYGDDNKEIFMCIGSTVGGVKNVVDPASTIKTCSVVCTAEEDWNKTPPSDEQVVACDHLLWRSFDLNLNKVRSLNMVVQQFGENYVTGVGGRNHTATAAPKSSPPSPQHANHRNALPRATGERTSVLATHPDRDSLKPDRSKELESEQAMKGLPQGKPPSAGLAPKSSPPAPQHANHRNALPRGTGERTSVLAAHPDRDGLKPDRSKELESEQAMKGLPQGKPPSAGLAPKSSPPAPHANHRNALPRATGERTSVLAAHPDRDGLRPDRSKELESEQAMKGLPRRKPPSPEARTKLSSEHGFPDSRKKAPIWSLETAVLEARKRQRLDSSEERASHKRPKLSGPADVDNKIADSAGHTSSLDQEPYVPKKRFFNRPWEQMLERAMENGQALHLQNLDPYFSSSEIEEMLQQLLRVNCDVRMLPPKDFSSYTSGEALVVFETCGIAGDAFVKLTENILIWSKDERPVVATIARKQKHRVNPFHGFLDLEMFSARNSHGQQKKNGTATSHCSQPNTVEYEMGIQWRLLKDRHTVAWRIAEHVCHVAHVLPFSIFASEMHNEKIKTLALQHKLG